MVSCFGEAWADAEAQWGCSVVFSALELHGVVVPVLTKTEGGNAEDQCEVRILGNPLSVQDTLGCWPSISEQIATVGAEGMAVGKLKQGCHSV